MPMHTLRKSKIRLTFGSLSPDSLPFACRASKMQTKGKETEGKITLLNYAFLSPYPLPLTPYPFGVRVRVRVRVIAEGEGYNQR